MKMCLQYFRGLPGLRIANRTRCRPVIFGASTISARDVQVMRFEPGLLEQQKSARHVELDVVRVRPNRNGRFCRHIYNFTAFPVAADWSAAKSTSCVRAASAKLVSRISLFLSSASKNAANCV